MDPDSGELIMTKLASSQDTSRGQYELKIQANDSGVLLLKFMFLFVNTYIIILYYS